ncbi:hypothetical protein [Tunturiibacter gelidoferens]|uniref:Uncharacterized protein n=1 Tax=Tunturiibacter gelidiferens TaxID=3069689 RepID=A0A9X0U265_9BACT|nr:hypothetical protein [Edaphobacter lichenicola]MBB5327069.1 hypothetical protein [Edaphobacter lichenicola]
MELGYATGIGILEISGSTGTFRNKLTQIYSGDNPVFADATHFYAYDSETSGAEFYRYSIDATGATLVDGTTLNGLGGFGGEFALDGGLVFGAGGGIINPSTTPPLQVAILPLGNGPYSSGLVGGGVVPYQAESKAFVVGVNDAGTAAYFLERFDTQHFTLEQQIQLLGNSVSGLSGTRFGQDGLAYLVPNTATSQTPQIFLSAGHSYFLRRQPPTHRQLLPMPIKVPSALAPAICTSRSQAPLFSLAQWHFGMDLPVQQPSSIALICKWPYPHPTSRLHKPSRLAARTLAP